MLNLVKLSYFETPCSEVGIILMIIVRWPDNNFFVSVVAFVSSEYLMTSSGGQVECDCCRVCDESCKKDEEAGGKTFLSQST